jgi:RNA recognition motif-containing protein
MWSVISAPARVKIMSEEPNLVSALENPSILQLDKKVSNRRYILFVGSLPYKATEDDIKKHFNSTPISIRIRTDKATKKPRGFIIVEFDNHTDFEASLCLNHSKSMGRNQYKIYTRWRWSR